MVGATLVLGAALGGASVARADARGACVETSASSAPTAAPLALDAERAAWVAGQGLLGADPAVAGHLPGRGGNPAWCEAGDGPECQRGDQAPTRHEHASSSDTGVALTTDSPTEVTASVLRPAHPPLRRGHGADGTRNELERPPRRG